MNTRLLMTAAALCLGLAGVLLSFLPAEVLAAAGLASEAPYPLLLQLLGALYFGYGMLNWMSRGSRIGGIYNRPIAVANLSHFLVGALSLLKAMPAAAASHPSFWAVLSVYALFALGFGIVLFRHPLPVQKEASRA